jgi:hypothetical protein
VAAPDLAGHVAQAGPARPVVQLVQLVEQHPDRAVWQLGSGERPHSAPPLEARSV